MSKVKDRIASRIAEQPELAKMFVIEQEKLDAALEVLKLRESLGLTQDELAKLIGKPQSTIGRIESGSVDVKLSTLAQIAHGTGKELRVEFI
ncbi:MAG: helix-turn-helix transcriptional regulator [Streptococcaceae bacterium]|nr:helix-turn-helix transcriptional regulator [Streptococcaceae bacterium]